jgi:hypothetical protein
MKVITVGRSTDNNDIVVNDERVSRNHLQMVMDDSGNYSVVDLGSTNGTYVNGRRISGEERLHPGDEVKIGHTVLPWQNYFAPMVASPMPPRPPKGPNRTWLYVIIGAALLLLIGGGVTWKIIDDKQKAAIEQEKKDKEEKDRQLEQEATDARIEASRLSEEAEAAARKAAETRSNKDFEYAEEMKKKADEANRKAKEKEQEWKRELDAANEAKEAAEQKSAEDKEAKDRAEQEAQAAREEAAKANKAKEEAEKTAQLTKEFYDLISKIDTKNECKKICEELKWGVMKKEDIIRRFNNTKDNAQKQRIVNAVKKALGQAVNNEVQPKTNSIEDVSEQPIQEVIDTIKP